MSIVSEINRINTNIANAYSKCNEKGATMPQVQNSSNLANTIDSISSGGGSSHDWSAIGYSSEPQEIGDGYNYAIYLKNNYSSGTFMDDMNLVYLPDITVNATDYYFKNCYNLTSISPSANIKLGSSGVQLFYYCYSLRDIPLLDTSTTKKLQNAFSNCISLTDKSLDNILKMCINTPATYSQTKTLAHIGFTSANYPASRIQALPSYQEFITAGWTIGY